MGVELVSESNYAFGHEWQQERDRLAAIEAWLDPGTVRHLSDSGIEPGWSCLEIGAGGGSIAAWMADQVGPSGHVLATDLQPHFVEALDRPNLQALRHDINRDPLPAAEFDLAHARLLVAHLTERRAAFDQIVAALKPGGWLVIEDMDFGSVAPDYRADPAVETVFGKALAAHNQVMGAHDMDPFYGRRALADLRAHGLRELGSEGRISCWAGGTGGTVAWRLTFERLREEMLDTGLLSSDELTTAIRILDNPGLTLLSQAVVAAWGRRPDA